MADSSNYVPSTTGLGQGAAQVFTPQAIQLDTSSIERGMYAGAGAIQQQMQAQKAAQAQAAKRQRDIIDAAENKDYDFPAIISYKDKAINNYISSDKSEEEAYRELQRELTHLDALNKNMKENIKMAKDNTGMYQNANAFDEESMSYTGGTTSLFNPLFDANIGDTPLEDFEVSMYQQTNPQNNESVIFTDPNFSEQKVYDTLQGRIKDAFAMQGQEIPADIYDDRTGKFDIIKTKEILGDQSFNEIVNSVATDPTLMGGFMSSRLVKDQASPYALQDENAQGIYAQQYKNMVYGMATPLKPLRTKTSVSRKPQGSDDEPTPEFETVTTKVESVDPLDLPISEAKIVDENGELLPSPYMTTRKDDFKIELEQALVSNKADMENLTHNQIVPTKAGVQPKEITFKGEKGIPSDIFIDNKGNGVMVMNVTKTVTRGVSTKDGKTSERDTESTKEVVPVMVPINKADVDYLQKLYKVKLGQQPQTTPPATTQSNNDPLGIL